MADLTEQRNVFMTRLQSLIDEKNSEISNKVAAYKAELDAEVNAKVQALKSELETEKVTPEISQLVTFVHQLDAMLEYERSGMTEHVKDVQDASKNANDEANAENTKTGFEAIAADIADTRARLNAASANKSAGSGIVLPRR